MITPTTDKVIKQLKKSNLSLEDRNALLTEIMDKLNVLPLNDSIVIGQGFIKINGKDLDPEQIINFRDSCDSLKSNFAFQVINEQVKYLAVNLGMYKSVNLDEIFFYKSGLWVMNEMKTLLDKIV